MALSPNQVPAPRQRRGKSAFPPVEERESQEDPKSTNAVSLPPASSQLRANGQRANSQGAMADADGRTMLRWPASVMSSCSPVATAAFAKSWQATAELMTLAWPRGARLTSFSYAPTPLHSAAARRTRPGQRRCAGPLLHSDCATLRKTGETREHPGGVSAASFCSSGAGPKTAPPTQELSALTTAPKVSLTSGRPHSGPGPRAHPDTPERVTAPALHSARPEVRTSRPRAPRFEVSAASSGDGSRSCEPVPPQGGELVPKITNGVRLRLSTPPKDRLSTAFRVESSETDALR